LKLSLFRIFWEKRFQRERERERKKESDYVTLLSAIEPRFESSRFFSLFFFFFFFFEKNEEK